ncbi:MAG: hypothetical protein II836_11290, partial [Clostridia bacterium]|nr:hypothetical protein [Clostridia bacterium]
MGSSTTFNLANVSLPATCTTVAGDVGELRSLSGYTVTKAASGQDDVAIAYAVEETKAEYGTGSLEATDVPTGATVYVLRADGTTVAATVTDGTARLSDYGTVKIDGVATGFDATFTNTLTMAYSEIADAYINTSTAAEYRRWDNGDGFYIRQAPWLSGGGQYFYDHYAEIGIVVVGKMTPSYNKIFIHIGIAAEFMMFSVDENDKLQAPYTESFEFSAGIAVRVVLFIASYELDAITYKVVYEHDSGRWKHGFYYLNDMVKPNEWYINAASDPEEERVTARLRKNTASEQVVYSPADNAADELSAQAYNATDPTVPFQISAYGFSRDAANLTKNIPEGGSYKAVRAGERNFLVYSLSRDGTEPEDAVMLVMSELAYSGGKYGLVNPADPASDVKYIVLDNESVPTGDLDFDVWAEEDENGGFTIRAAWVSYATQTVDPGTSDSGMADVQERARIAAENTVIKTASFTSGSDSFSEPLTVSDNDSTHCVFLPASAGDGSVIFYGSTFTPDDGTAYEEYRAYQDGKHIDTGIANYLKATRKGTLNVMGVQSALNLAVRDADGKWVTTTVPVGQKHGQTLSNVEFTRGENGGWYAAYTTEQTIYTDDDMVTIYRLYLRSFAVEDGQAVWSAPVLIRELRDFDQNKGADGVYSKGRCIGDYDDPYFADLTFLTAKLDAEMLTGGEPLSELETQAVRKQLLLLFEMDGTTYIIPEDMLETISAGRPGGLIYPFFTPP